MPPERVMDVIPKEGHMEEVTRQKLLMENENLKDVLRFLRDNSRKCDGTHAGATEVCVRCTVDGAIGKPVSL
jgi:hypothetical protein